MSKLWFSILIGITFWGGTVLAHQTAPTIPDRVVGEVSAVDVAARQLTVTTTAGSVVITASESTSVLRLPAGETSADKAVTIKLDEISIGDRVFARGEISADGKSISARQIVATAAAASARREDWRTRGIAGRISEIHSAAKQIVLLSRQRDGVRTVNLDASRSTRFFRYAADSLDLDHARPGTFEELRVGDQLRALGQRSADGSRFTADEIISVSFVRWGGTVTGTNPTAPEITVRNPQGEKVRVAFGKRSNVRRVTPEAAAAFTESRQVAATRVAADRDAVASRTTRAGSLHEMVGRLPVISPLDLEKGDTVILTGTYEKDRSRVTAVMLITGEADFLNQFLLSQPGRGPQSPGLPGDILGGGILDRDEP